jgi:uncharacterized membrane protein YqjE
MNGNNFAQPNQLRSQPARSLLLRLFNDISSLVNQEYQLVRTELIEKRGAVTRTALSFGFAAALGLLALACLTAAIVSGLSVSLGFPLAALIVAVAYAVVAAILGLLVQRMIAKDAVFHTAGQLLPKGKPTTKTVEEQEADVIWTRKRIEETLTALERKSDIVQPLRDAAVGMGALGVAVTNIVREEAARTTKT